MQIGLALLSGPAPRRQEIVQPDFTMAKGRERQVSGNLWATV